MTAGQKNRHTDMYKILQRCLLQGPQAASAELSLKKVRYWFDEDRG
jgi:hypothetical protein